MFNLTELELRLAAMTVFLPGDSETVAQEIVTDLLTKDPDGKYSGFVFADPQCKAIIASAMTALKNSLLPSPPVIARWLSARQNFVFGKATDDIERAVAKFAVEERGTEKPDVRIARFYASELERVAARRNLFLAAKEQEEIAVSGIGDPGAVYAQMHTRLGDSMPPSTSDALNGDQIDEVWLKEMQFRQVLVANKVPFLTLPPKLGLGNNIKRLKPGDSTIITGPTKSGKCISGDTLISTDRGLIRIDSLVPENSEPDHTYPVSLKVRSTTGVIAASHIYDGGIKPTLKITTLRGYQLTGTLVHPVLTIQHGGEFVWKKLGDLHPGDYVAVHRHDHVFGTSTALPQFTFEKKANDVNSTNINPPTILDEETAYVLGLIVGNGGVTCRQAIMFSSVDKSVLHSISEWIEHLGLAFRYNSGCDWRISSVQLHQWLQDIGISGYSYEKTIPEVILRAPRQYIRAFLQGLFDTDGSAETCKGKVSYCSASETLARQVHLLLLHFGITASLRFKKNDKHCAWEVTIAGDADKFYARIGFRLSRKQAKQSHLPANKKPWGDSVPYLPSMKPTPLGHRHVRGDFREEPYTSGARKPCYATLEKMAINHPELSVYLENPYLWEVVESVEEAGEQHVYDLVVPETHAFVGNGIVCHNTSACLELIEHVGVSGQGMMHCLYFHAETQVMDLQDRLVSSRSGVSMEDLRNGVTNERVDEALAAMKQWKKYTTFVYCAGWTPEQISATIRRFAARLHKWQSLLVIVDYVDQDKLNLSHYKTDNVAYQIGKAFSVLRATAEQCTWKGERPGAESVYKGFVHVLSFQQENDEGRARGSRAGTMYSQNYIRMARMVIKKPYDASGIYAAIDPDNPLARNCVLNKGADAPFVQFQVIATNDGYPGTTYVVVDKFKFLFPVDESISEYLEEKELKKKSTYTKYSE